MVAALIDLFQKKSICCSLKQCACSCTREIEQKCPWVDFCWILNVRWGIMKTSFRLSQPGASNSFTWSYERVFLSRRNLPPWKWTWKGVSLVANRLKLYLPETYWFYYKTIWFIFKEEKKNIHTLNNLFCKVACRGKKALMFSFSVGLQESWCTFTVDI